MLSRRAGKCTHQEPGLLPGLLHTRTGFLLVKMRLSWSASAETSLLHFFPALCPIPGWKRVLLLSLVFFVSYFYIVWLKPVTLLISFVLILLYRVGEMSLRMCSTIKSHEGGHACHILDVQKCLLACARDRCCHLRRCGISRISEWHWAHSLCRGAQRTSSALNASYGVKEVSKVICQLNVKGTQGEVCVQGYTAQSMGRLELYD